MIAPEARGAWRELEARLRPYVARRLAASCDVDDVVQDVFVRMHRGLADLRDSDRFGGWVYTIAEHAVADHLRKRARHLVAGHSNVQLEDEVAEWHDAGGALEADLAECVTLFVSRLTSPYRDAITLTELQGLTQKDAAEMLGLSPSCTKSRVHRGREQIRRMFEECCEISVDARGHIVDCTPRLPAETPEDSRAPQCRALQRAP